MTIGGGHTKELPLSKEVSHVQAGVDTLKMRTASLTRGWAGANPAPATTWPQRHGHEQALEMGGLVRRTPVLTCLLGRQMTNAKQPVHRLSRLPPMVLARSPHSGEQEPVTEVASEKCLLRV